MPRHRVAASLIWIAYCCFAVCGVAATVIYIAEGRAPGAVGSAALALYGVLGLIEEVA